MLRPMLTFFCPQCWNEIEEDTEQCPHCGFDLRQLPTLSYDERLVLSLRHSVAEYRLTAARILGQRGAVAALPAFQRIIETEHDYYLLREVLYALLNIKDPLSAALLQQATEHPSQLVSQLARELSARLQT